jgi:hypothetical protein
MSSTLRDMTDAMYEALASLSYESVDVQPNVVRQNWMTYSVEELATPLIAIAPGSLTITRTDRLRHQYEADVLVFVGRYVQSEAEADAAYDLVEEVIDKIRAHTWGEDVTFPATSPTSIELEINPDDALNERNVWRAIVTARYTVFRGLS